MRRFTVLILLLILLVALGMLFASGCSSTEKKTTLTEHQRDSVLARSSLPGAGVVGRALEESDKAAAHAADLDSMPQ